MGKHRSEGPPQNAVEREQFRDIVELWQDGREHHIPREWFVEDVERISYDMGYPQTPKR